jgi:molybdenum cofactor synthesis domain-containing protein
MHFSVGIIIVSDRAADGQREDKSLPVFQHVLSNSAFEIVRTAIIPDDSEAIRSTLRSFIGDGLSLILTSGGTGCAVRDITPDITKEFIGKATPGVDEAIRAFSGAKTGFAMYSRGASGVADRSFIVNLPGSPKAVSEIMEFLLPTIDHPLRLMAGDISDCSTEIPSDNKQGRSG